MKKRERQALITLLTSRSWLTRLAAVFVLIAAIANFSLAPDQATINGIEPGQLLVGEIVGVSDGDTVTLLMDDNVSLKIRLAFIDAPEKNQAFGQAAKKSLSQLVYQQQALVEVVNKDQYQRVVARLWIKQQDINLLQIKQGYAWHYRVFAKKTQSYEEFALYEEAQRVAKEIRQGLWQDAYPIPPWEFRRRQRNKSQSI